MRKYIDELGIKHEDTPQGWNQDDDRQSVWREQREEYGFDSRETWSLDYSFKLWLYERLCMYNEINPTDTSYHKFEYEGETLSLQDCLDKMIEGLRIDLKLQMYSIERNSEDVKNKINDVMPIFGLCYKCLWW